MFSVVRFPNVRSRWSKPFADDWMQFVDLLHNHKERIDKDKGDLYSPVTYIERTSRSNANVTHIHAFVADLDGQGFEQARLDRITYCAYTTWSHRDEDPHWHVVIPFTEPVPVGWWGIVWQETVARLRLPADPATKDPARIFYLPQHAAGMPFEVRYQGGKMVDPTLNDITEPARIFTGPNIRNRHRSSTRTRAAAFLDEDFWTRPKNMSRYEGLSKRESLLLIYDDLLALEKAVLQDE